MLTERREALETALRNLIYASERIQWFAEELADSWVIKFEEFITKPDFWLDSADSYITFAEEVIDATL